MTTAEAVRAITRIAPAGDEAAVVEFEPAISRAINAKVRALDRAVVAANWPEVRATVPAYRSLLIYYDPVASSFSDLASRIRALSDIAGGAPVRARRWRIPICYELGSSDDLAALSTAVGLTIPQIIQQHAEPEYLVYMIGFSPGFAYLGELALALEIPRKATPAPSVPANAIQIGGRQTALSSMAMPSGWYVVGRTPVPMYMQGRQRPFLLEGGDRVQFEIISSAEFDRLAKTFALTESEPAWDWVV